MPAVPQHLRRVDLRRGGWSSIGTSRDRLRLRTHAYRGRDLVSVDAARGVGARCVGRALERGVVEVDYFDPRDYAVDVHRTVDDRPYGGGPGMVLKVEPLRDALRARARRARRGTRTVYLGADGVRFEQSRAREARDWPGLILVAGRYEGVDERFIEREIDEQWSIGDYVLSGGELPALVVIDAIARLIPGNARKRRVGGAGVVHRRFARLAALHAAAGVDGRGCRRCCRPATTPRSGAGDCSRRWAARGCAGRSCWSGAA